ncbi:FABP family protein [Galbitalea sp. SE-J8]|uniref:FABP family protein n=1 Tax=Galbitalea sp. SE-J8 TaxID=3054952 RepID=UPI00259D2DE6|nr:FABP family protein [Galbitalea sp. SE-J8]MDM4763768.1 FABP family protein [Galbitalea sp. SE-J8]
MIEIDGTLPPELVPLSWLVGLWEGTAVVHYGVGDETLSLEVGHRVSFSHDGLPYLNYSSTTWLLEPSGASGDAGDALDERGALADGGARRTPFASELGYWRLARDIRADEPGPGLLPPTAPPVAVTADDVERLRLPNGAFGVEAQIVHPDGIGELYLGQVAGPRIDLATDAVVRTAHAKDYTAATRLLGLVEGRLLWAWDIAALGQGLASHASGTLERLE